MIQMVLGLLATPVINGIISGYKAKLDAGNTSERIAADLAAKDIELTKRERELQAQIVVAEQGHAFTRWVRPMWALPFVIWTWKVVIWDKVLGLGTTDELHGMAGWLLVTIAGAYFIGRSAEKIASTIKR
jgi:hypothetical protein